jgi:hypothetical protein
MPEYSIFELGSQKENARKIAARAVENYPLEWVVVHEVLQNSLDAIQKGAAESGTVTVKLDIGNKRVTVKDDGKGFPHDVNLLGLGGTDKDNDPDSDKLGGNLGVGLKVVILSSQKFEVESVVAGKKWSSTVEGGFGFKDGADVRINASEEENTEGPNGTVVDYTFPANQVADFLNQVCTRHIKSIDDDLARGVANKVKLAIEYHFRTYSYAGNVSRLLGLEAVKPITIKVEVVCDEPSRTFLDESIRNAFANSEVLTCEFPNKHWDLDEMVSRLPPRIRRPYLVADPRIPEAGRFERYPADHILVKKFTTPDEMKTLLRNPFLREQVDVESYRTFFDQLEGIYMVIGSVDLVGKFLVERQRQFVAAFGVPTAHQLRIPVGIGELGYAANIHLIISVKQKLNLGKQTITNPWLVGMCNDYFRDAFKATLRHITRAFVGEEQVDSSGEALERLGEPETNIIGRPELGLPLLSIVKQPAVEAEVVALFYELIGRGYLPGYKTWSLYHVGKYDGKGMMKIASAGVMPTPRSDDDLRNFEFKFKLSEIVDDFESGKKKPGDITLIVVWESDEIRHPDFQVVDIGQTADRDRYMDHVKTCLTTRAGRTIQVLTLKDVVEELKPH